MAGNSKKAVNSICPTPPKRPTTKDPKRRIPWPCTDMTPSYGTWLTHMGHDSCILDTTHSYGTWRFHVGHESFVCGSLVALRVTQVSRERDLHHTKTHTSHAHTHTLARTHTQTMVLYQTHTHSPSPAHPPTHTHALPILASCQQRARWTPVIDTHSVHTHTHTHTYTYTHTHTHTLALSHTDTHTSPVMKSS